MPSARLRPGEAFALDRDRYHAIALGGEPSLARRTRLWLLHPDFRCVACFRFGQWAQDVFASNRLLGILPLVASTLWRRRVSTVHHANIDRSAAIGPGFYVMHGFGLFVGPVTIGANCVLHQNVTIGQRVAAGDQGVPRIGDNVWVGPGATISGAISIGDGVTISAGTVISKSVPDGALVAGNPGRVIQRDYDNRSMMTFLVPPQRVPQDDRHGT